MAQNNPQPQERPSTTIAQKLGGKEVLDLELLERKRDNLCVNYYAQFLIN